jgi:hypothetical protein
VPPKPRLLVCEPRSSKIIDTGSAVVVAVCSVGTNGVRPSYASKYRARHVCTDQVDIGEVGVGKVGPYELRMLKISTLEGGVVEVSDVSDQITVNKHPTCRERCRSTRNTTRPAIDESGTFKLSALEIAAGKACTLKLGAPEIGVREVRAFEVGASEVGVSEVAPFEICVRAWRAILAETFAPEVAAAAKIRTRLRQLKRRTECRPPAIDEIGTRGTSNRFEAECYRQCDLIGVRSLISTLFKRLPAPSLRRQPWCRRRHNGNLQICRQAEASHQPQSFGAAETTASSRVCRCERDLVTSF